MRLAQDMALDYGKELKIHRKPAVELRYERGAGFSRGLELLVLFWSRHTANQVLTMPLVKDPDPAGQTLIPDADLQPQEQ